MLKPPTGSPYRPIVPFSSEVVSGQPFQDLAGQSPVADLESMLDGWGVVRESGVEFERAIGRYITISAALLQILATRRRAVAKVAVRGGVDYTGQAGDWSGTGFLVSENLFLTNHHVLNTVAVAAAAQIEFDYEIAVEALLGGRFDTAESRKVFQLDPNRLFVTSPSIGGLDYTFVWVDASAAREFGTVPLERASFSMKQGEQAFVIHHPDGRMKEASVDDTDILAVDSRFVHYASDTDYGSSGAPVFNRQGNLISLHHASRRQEVTLPDGHVSQYINEGIKIAAIAIDLEAKAQGTGPEASMAREVLAVIKGSDTLTGFFGGLGRRPAAVNDLERVVNTYKGDEADVDIGFWNIERLTTLHGEDGKLEGAAAVIADMKLDVWGLAEVSPTAVDALVERIRTRFGEDYAVAYSEPNAAAGKMSTAVIWRTQTLEGGAVDWPETVKPLFLLDSRDPAALEFEAIHGKIFDRYPGLFHFRTKTTDGGQPFSFHLVPLHLKAMAEGSLRRRMASAILRRALEALRAEGFDDIIIGGDINAPLASGDFDKLADAGYVAMGAEDEQEGSFTYLKRPKSLIDNIFLSPNLARTFGADEFLIVARDREIGDFVRTISDHRPVMVRLSLAAARDGALRPAFDPDALLQRAQAAARTQQAARPAPVRETRLLLSGDLPPPDTITFEELKRRMRDITIPDQELARYLKIEEGAAGPFDPQIEPDPQHVVIDPAAHFELESAIDWGNGISRWRRAMRFNARLAAGERLPVLVSEGDSWFQFPFFIDDVIDHLGKHYLISSLDAAGDTAENMIHRAPEYMRELAEQKRNGLAAFLISAAGNDVVGSDPMGRSVLLKLLREHQPGKNAARHIDTRALKETLDYLEQAYRKVVATIRADADLKRLPIIVHGYDYSIPGGHPGDPRRVSWAAQDKWLGAAMRAKGIFDVDLQRAIVQRLIDALYDMLERVAGESAQTRVFVVDARGALGPVENWADELHGTSEGYGAVALRFKAVIERAIAS